MLTNNFEEAWESKDYQKILASAFKKYLAHIEEEEVLSMKMNILWRCMNRYKDGMGMSFTTYLYTQARYTVLNYLKKNSKNFKTKTCEPSFIEGVINSKVQIDGAAKGKVSQLLMDLPQEDRTIIHQRFFDRMTYNQIAEANNLHSETVRKRIKSILYKSRRLVS